MTKLGQALKAIYATVGAALTGVGTALVGAHTFGQISDGTWITVAALALGAGAAVYGVTNAPKTGPPIGSP